MQRFLYPAVFFKYEDEYKVIIPDVNITTDCINMEGAYLYAAEFLKEYMKYAIKYDLGYNLPTEYERVAKSLKKDETCMFIDVTITDQDLKTKKEKSK